MDLPVPEPTETTQPFWDGLRQGKLVIQYSPSADQWVFYPRVLAPGTLADDLEWREITGAGQVYTYSIGRRPTAPPWGDRVPQIIAVVAVDEGAHIPTELVDVEPDDVTVGMRVRPVFERAADGTTVLLKFRPAGD
jgi:uncharacterized OB-fold protein